MNAVELLEHLDGVTTTRANQWNARCPAHDDRHASLAVSEGNGSVLLKCFAGCGVGAIVTALGLSWHDLFLDAPARARVRIPSVAQTVTRTRPVTLTALPPAPIVEAWAGAIGEVADRLHEVKGWSLATLQALGIGWDGGRVTIPVRDAEGRLLTVLRYLPGGDPKMLAPGGRPRPLFPDPTGTSALWLVEGEPDAISMWELNVGTAVAVPGVDVWKQEWSERLHGRRVTICFDCDVQGRQAARERQRELRRADVEARVVDLFPGRQGGYDLGDVLAQATAQSRVAEARQYLTELMEEAWR